MKPAEIWNRFWFRTGPTTSLGLFRIIFAAMCLWREVGTTEAKSVFSVQGDGFHLPYVWFIKPLPEAWFEWIHSIEYVLVVLIGVGLFARPVCALLCSMQAYVFFADQLNFRNHPYFFILALLIMTFSPCDDALSVKALWRSLREGKAARFFLGTIQPLTWQRLLAFQVTLIYVFAAIHKLNVGYLSGEVVGKHLDGVHDPSEMPWLVIGWISTSLLDHIDTMMRTESFLVASSYMTVAMEFFIPVALWFRRTRPIAIAVGVPFHMSISWLMGINAFSYATIGSYLLFLEPETLPRWLRKAGRLFKRG